MSSYKGLFTYDIDSHRYIPVEQVDGVFKPAEPTPEPKTCWYLDCNGEPIEKSEIANYYNPRMKEIGNYFSSREEAEKAVERLRAWKRLRDKGFRFVLSTTSMDKIDIVRECFDGIGQAAEAKDDIITLFGGEE